jgi:single-strand DNA-binding protein
MNKVILMGNLTRDPEMRTTQSNIPVCTFTLAVERRYKTASGERPTDFINVVAWRQQAEFVSRYFHKGSRMVLVGSLQTRSYDDKDGNKRTATEVIADEIYFGDTRKASQGGYEPAPQSGAGAVPAGPSAPVGQDGFFPSPDDDTSLPFDL